MLKQYGFGNSGDYQYVASVPAHIAMLGEFGQMITDLHQQYFRDHGFVVVEQFVPKNLRLAAARRFDALFRGEFETGIQPDEWNWREGVSPPDHTRQICNGWKSDRAIARLVLREEVGRACAELMQWPGSRINQDNVIWKPPGAKALGFHQDDAYQDWIVPSSMVTCWMASCTRNDSLRGVKRTGARGSFCSGASAITIFEPSRK